MASLGIAILGTLGSAVAAAASVQGHVAQEALHETADLGDLVEDYFRTDDPKERSKLVGSIDRAGHGDLAAVARAMGEVSLWTSLPNDVGTFAFESAIDGKVRVAYRLPEDYAPSLRYPMVVCIPGAGAAARDTLALAMAALGEAAKGFVFICPVRPVRTTFCQPVEAASDVQRLLRRARREIHIDTDRVFLFGFGQGGETAWMTAITQPDPFAGVIVLSAYPRLPYPEQVYTFLLNNLRRLPVLTVWRSPDGTHVATRQAVVAAHNRAIVAFAERAALPVIGIEVPRNEPAGLRPPTDEVRTMLARRRLSPSPVVSHWFRYPAHGRADWLWQGRFTGEVWEADQLAIAVSPAADRDKFIADVVKSKLGYLGGRIEGRNITLNTRRCARVDLLLPMGLVDLTKPILVRCNGKRRYDRLLEPSVRTLLETAYERWEFQHPVAARLSFSVRTDAELD